MFRTADATGVEKIFLIGYTPTPVDRFGRAQAEITKTSLGASEEIGWEHLSETTDLVKKLQAEGVIVVAVEQCPESVTLKEFVVPDKVAYIVGNEVGGVDAETLKIVDTIVDIPMLGKKESLNVSVTAGIVLYHGLV